MGFARAARAADLPDVIVRFNPQAFVIASTLRIRALPDIAASRRPRGNTDVERGPMAKAADTGLRRCGRTRVAAATRSSPDAYVSSRFGEVVIERSLVAGSGAFRWAGPSTSSVWLRSVWSVSRSRPTTSLLSRSRSRGSICQKRRSMPDSDRIRTLRSTWRRSGFVIRVAKRGARPGPGDELRPARNADRHALGGAGSARPGGGDRDRLAGRAVGSRARDGRG